MVLVVRYDSLVMSLYFIMLHRLRFKVLLIIYIFLMRYLQFMHEHTSGAVRGRFHRGVNGLHHSKGKPISFAQGLFVCLIIALSHQWHDRGFVGVSGFVRCSSINTSHTHKHSHFP